MTFMDETTQQILCFGVVKPCSQLSTLRCVCSCVIFPNIKRKENKKGLLQVVKSLFFSTSVWDLQAVHKTFCGLLFTPNLYQKFAEFSAPPVEKSNRKKKLNSKINGHKTADVTNNLRRCFELVGLCNTNNRIYKCAIQLYINIGLAVTTLLSACCRTRVLKLNMKDVKGKLYLTSPHSNWNSKNKH